MSESSPAPLASAPADQVDPDLRAAYSSLPLEVQCALIDGDPAAADELRRAYKRVKASYVPVSRAARRAALFSQRRRGR